MNMNTILLGGCFSCLVLLLIIPQSLSEKDLNVIKRQVTTTLESKTFNSDAVAQELAIMSDRLIDNINTTSERIIENINTNSDRVIENANLRTETAAQKLITISDQANGNIKEQTTALTQNNLPFNHYKQVLNGDTIEVSYIDEYGNHESFSYPTQEQLDKEFMQIIEDL